jgi:hypothetical protein
MDGTDESRAQFLEQIVILTPYPHDIRLNVLYPPLEVVDVPALPLGGPRAGSIASGGAI